MKVFRFSKQTIFSIGQRLAWEATSSSGSQTYSTSYETRSFITFSTVACHSCATWILSTPHSTLACSPVPLMAILILLLSSLRFRSGIIPSGFLTIIFFTYFYFFPICAMSPARFIRLNLITQIIFGDKRNHNFPHYIVLSISFPAVC